MLCRPSTGRRSRGGSCTRAYGDALSASTAGERTERGSLRDLHPAVGAHPRRLYLLPPMGVRDCSAVPTRESLLCRRLLAGVPESASGPCTVHLVPGQKEGARRGEIGAPGPLRTLSLKRSRHGLFVCHIQWTVQDGPTSHVAASSAVNRALSLVVSLSDFSGSHFRDDRLQRRRDRRAS